MKDANHALDILGRKFSLPNLSFTNDQVGIQMPSELMIFLTRLDDQTIEISCQLDGLDYPDAAMMQAMLEANFLGGATGAARLALDADKAEVVLCEEWTVTDFEAPALERRFAAFTAAAAFWQGEGTSLLLEQATTIRAANKEEGTLPPGGSDDEEAPVLMRL